MSFKSALAHLGEFLQKHNVQYTTVTEGDAAAVLRNKTTSISLSAVSDTQTLISFVQGTTVSSAVFSGESMGDFLASNVKEGLSMLSPPIALQEAEESGQKDAKESGSLRGSRKDVTESISDETRGSSGLRDRDLRENRGLMSLTRPADMPDFEDEYETKSRSFQPQSAPFSIGDGDLYPAGTGPHPQLKPYIDPLAAPGSGMMPGAGHPVFGRDRENTARLGVPPGARFDDPYGEDNLDDLGLGLPGNLRSPGSFGNFGHSGGGFGGGAHFG